MKNCYLALGFFLALSCTGKTPTSPDEASGNKNDATGVVESQASVLLASNIVSVLTGVTTDTDFTFFIQAEDGRTIHYDRGASRMSTVYESASTSKWVTATIILSLVDRGFLSLDDRPQDFISWWPIGASDPLYNIRLRDLLSFTSGLVVEPGGLDSMDNPFGTMSNDVRAIALSNAGNGKTPATEFWYASTHLQVAGYMAVLARGAVDWQEVFKEFQARTGLFSTAQYDLPSVKNPRLAGGMHWSGNEYFRFIKAYYDKQILSPAMHDLAISDQLIGKSVPFFGSPIRMRLGQDWHYGFGLWLESTNASFNGQILAYSSPGAYGAYPFMNPQNRFYGMVARQGTNGTFPNGVAIYQAVMPLVIEWARTR